QHIQTLDGRMKFRKCLKKNIVGHWRDKYIDYEYLKSLINDPARLPPQHQTSSSSLLRMSGGSVSNENVSSTPTPGNSTDQLSLDISPDFGDKSTSNTSFLVEYIKEVDKIDSFYHSRYIKFINKCDELEKMVQFVVSNVQVINKRNTYYIKNGYRDLYRSLSLLESFGEINRRGFEKLLKKCDKDNEAVSHQCREYSQHKSFWEGKEASFQLHQIRLVYARYFTGNDFKLAKESLRTQQPGENTRSLFLVGIQIGLCLILTIINIYIYMIYYPRANPPHDAPMAWLLFRISLLPILLGLLFAMQTFIWDRTGINYVFIFDLKPEYSRSTIKYLQYGLFFIMFWLISFFLYIESSSNRSMLRYVIMFPLIFIGLSLLVTINPFPIMAHKTRFWVLTRISRVVRAPFVQVTFSDFFMSVQLLTLSEFFFNIQSMICVFNHAELYQDELSFCNETINLAFPLLNGLPYYFRVMQCVRRYYETRQFFPHMTSAIRSIISIIILVLSYLTLITTCREWSPLMITWFLVNSIGSMYKWYADVAVDWGFFLDYSKNKAFPLREKLYFKRKWIYYIAIVTDLMFRYMWLLVFLIRKNTQHRLDHPLFLFFYSMGELVWSAQFIFFRVEAEHCQTADKYSLFVDIPAPFSDEYNQYLLSKQVLDTKESTLPD
ncbi:hypothetical protein SAMD00019534_059010, partial [Acytostelium subglobosum LB1]|uniref:hypothetical protein n=1 Tax=Acytostelium subglobosum LB1 TaxID=1410327 RepID=UPI00064518E2